MNAASPMSTTSVSELVDLAWELTCSAGIVVKIDRVSTDRGVELCLSARCVAGEHAFMLIPRSPQYVEVWWGEYESALELVGMASDVESILKLARRTCQGEPPAAPISLDTARAGRTARTRWRRTA
jgi:hypothetical protein